MRSSKLPFRSHWNDVLQQNNKEARVMKAKACDVFAVGNKGWPLDGYSHTDTIFLTQQIIFRILLSVFTQILRKATFCVELVGIAYLLSAFWEIPY
jgi:hypothetical protein